MRLVSKFAVVLKPAGSRRVLLAHTHTVSARVCLTTSLLTSTKPVILINHDSRHKRSIQFYPWLMLILSPHNFLSWALKGQPCLSCREQSYCFVYASGFPTFPPPEEKSLEGGKLHLDEQYSTSQEACLFVCSTRATTGDLRGDQGVLRLQALRP